MSRPHTLKWKGGDILCKYLLEHMLLKSMWYFTSGTTTTSPSEADSLYVHTHTYTHIHVLVSCIYSLL